MAQEPEPQPVRQCRFEFYQEYSTYNMGRIGILLDQCSRDSWWLDDATGVPVWRPIGVAQ